MPNTFPAMSFFSPLSGKNLVALAMLASFLNICRLFAGPRRDRISCVHYSLIECFSRQVWEGNLYPRWCMEGNAGLGAPDFLFYFPAPYYIAALFYPFHFIGLSIENIYLCALFQVGAVTFITCRLWLSDMVDSKRALLASFFFLWLPYRLELVYYRSAYAELWQMALLPLLFLWLRRLATGRTKDWLTLAAIIALGLFTHVPTTLIALAAGGMYYLLLTPDRHTIWCFLAAAALAFMLCAIYAFPAYYFLSAMDPVALEGNTHIWASSFWA